MKRLMTKQFTKWVKKQSIPEGELFKAIDEVVEGSYEANLGSSLIKKRIRFQGQGKSGSGRSILCFKSDDRAIYIHGFSKNSQSNINSKELLALKELAKVLLALTSEGIEIAIENGDFIEVTEL